MTRPQIVQLPVYLKIVPFSFTSWHVRYSQFKQIVLCSKYHYRVFFHQPRRKMLPAVVLSHCLLISLQLLLEVRNTVWIVVYIERWFCCLESGPCSWSGDWVNLFSLSLLHNTRDAGSFDRGCIRSVVTVTFITWSEFVLLWLGK